MPSKVKVYLSIIVALAAIGGFFFQQHLGMERQSYAALVLGVIAIVSMWIFPEVSHKKKNENQAD